jgi:hypothetical protein
MNGPCFVGLFVSKKNIMEQNGIDWGLCSKGTKIKATSKRVDL